LRKAHAGSTTFLARATPATLALLSTPGGPGCIHLADWQRYGAWMHTRDLVKQLVPATVMSTRFLPRSCR
jgi:hypothetical protein